MRTVVDLFSGCGGGTMGFHRAGFRTVGAVEIDSDAAAAFTMNTGVAPIIKDIRDVRGEDLLAPTGLRRGELTLLFGCPPCQSFSVLRRAAKPLDYDEQRRELIYEYLRLVDEIHPRHIAFENVPGLVEGRWRPYYDAFEQILARLGYKIKQSIVDAAEFGVPQRRRRVLVIGSRVTEPELPQPTHWHTKSRDRSSYDGRSKFVSVRDAIGHLPRLEPGEQDPLDEFHKARRHSAKALERLSHIPEGGGRSDLPDHLVLDCHRGHNGHHDIYGRMRWDEVAPTLTSGCTNITRGRFAHPEQNRAITLREAMLLQTFDETARLYGGIEKGSLQVGNAVPSLLAQRIGLTISEMDSRGTLEGTDQ
ncbi:DNA cytosine methyltransferase [Solwaraspora sp. WMMA2059]|uniref:DNA cytosine methyltransferase n=1 Tax=Solwaraspora sp. WMMA2059 TaxID=3015160 RepID=UPI00248C9D58|nr:DNA cytosine methyltransferase [Solwaraspora sp. WMMA2059]WBB96398.1 DNA cytosine methyltransferase [Solwaraspora sp. WMMA2059]